MVMLPAGQGLGLGADGVASGRAIGSAGGAEGRGPSGFSEDEGGAVCVLPDVAGPGCFWEAFHSCSRVAGGPRMLWEEGGEFTVVPPRRGRRRLRGWRGCRRRRSPRSSRLVGRRTWAPASCWHLARGPVARLFVARVGSERADHDAGRAPTRWAGCLEGFVRAVAAFASVAHVGETRETLAHAATRTSCWHVSQLHHVQQLARAQTPQMSQAKMVAVPGLRRVMQPPTLCMGSWREFRNTHRTRWIREHRGRG